MKNFEKVNPSHPDKVADRIAGALVDIAYNEDTTHKVAVEVLLGHGSCFIIIESSRQFDIDEVSNVVYRITGNYRTEVHLRSLKQDEHLAENQNGKIRCGDNGIFKGVPMTEQEKILTTIAKKLYEKHPSDGKFIYGEKNVFCQSNVITEELRSELNIENAIINPLGEWTGGVDVDSGATNRKLGSDMGGSATGGGLCGKDLSKSDVAVNIYCFIKAQKERRDIEAVCAIGDEFVLVDGEQIPYTDIVEVAREYIEGLGGFEKFAEWGLIR